MQERVTTSFIPKASLSVEREATVRKSPASLMNIIGGAVFTLAILASAGAFVFERYTVQSIESKRLSLEKSRAAFEPETIRELSKLDTKIQTGTKLLATHTALSILFDELEKRTLTSVSFSNFSFDMSSPEQILLSMGGQAKSFNAVAFQSGKFSESPVISEPIFEDVNIGEKGTINFNFSAIVDLNHMRYQQVISPPAATEIPGQEDATPTDVLLEDLPLEEDFLTEPVPEIP